MMPAVCIKCVWYLLIIHQLLDVYLVDSALHLVFEFCAMDLEMVRFPSTGMPQCGWLI
jgi:hypothetical protein